MCCSLVWLCAVVVCVGCSSLFDGVCGSLFVLLPFLVIWLFLVFGALCLVFGMFVSCVRSFVFEVCCALCVVVCWSLVIRWLLQFLFGVLL